MSDRRIRVGIAGLGRSGWNIHSNALAVLKEQYKVSAVTDPDAKRRAEAVDRFGARPHETLQGLLDDNDVELIVIATPNRHHAQHVMAALRAGKHVVCEKPLAAASAEVAEMIELSQKAGRILSPFQNRRYEATFQKVLEVIGSGKLGRIVQIRVAIHGFGRRWDWQTLREFNGGELNNTGPHFIDQLLQLFGPQEPEVHCWTDRTLTSGDAEDHVKVILSGPGAPLIDLEITSSCAYGQQLWLVMGTSGGLSSDGAVTTWKYVDLSKMPPRPVERQPTPDRRYNSEELKWQEESWTKPEDATIPQTHQRFYKDLFKTIRESAPLVVTPQSVMRQIAVIERCHQLSLVSKESELSNPGHHVPALEEVSK